jgi:hypothetical protein
VGEDGVKQLEGQVGQADSRKHGTQGLCSQQQLPLQQLGNARLSISQMEVSGDLAAG